jgi:pimeloyl-ACP methyl ester carboxylesterase
MFDSLVKRRAHPLLGRTLACLAVATVAALSGCGGGDDDAAARVRATACSYSVPGIALSCGTLDVPENYDKPQGRRVSLPYLVVPASASGAKAEPVVFLTGGPGYSAIADLGSIVAAQPIYARRDLIVIEQRGNGDARPGLHCGDETPAQCHARLRASGIDLSQYSTANAARDLIELRKALGYQRWNLWGVSYGVSTAFAILRADPAGVSAAILDSGSEPGDIAYADVQSNLDGYTRLFAACAADGECNAAYPDLRQRFLQTFETLNRQPLSIAGSDLEAAIGAPQIDGNLFALLAAQVQQTAVFARVPAMIDAFARGEPALLLEVLAEFQASRPAPPLGFDRALETSVGLTYSVYCGEVPYSKLESQPVQTIEAWPGPLVAALTPDYYRVCQSGDWPVARVPAQALALVSSDARTLFLSGALDPITPPRQAEIGSARFTRKTLITVPWETHGLVGRNACATKLAATFLDRELRADDRACLDRIPKPSFVR